MDHNDLNAWMHICTLLLLLASSWLICIKVRRLSTFLMALAASGLCIVSGLRWLVTWLSKGLSAPSGITSRTELFHNLALVLDPLCLVCFCVGAVLSFRALKQITTFQKRNV